MDEESREPIEDAIRAHLQHEARELQAPSELWPNVRSALEEKRNAPRRPSFPRRWLAIPALAGVGAAALLLVTLVQPMIGGEGELDAGDILARAAEAAENPESVGLTTYVGEAEYSGSFRLEFAGTRRDREVQGVLRIWLKAPDRVRLEAEGTQLGSSGEGETRKLSVADGETFWTYDQLSRTYGRQPQSDDEASGENRLDPFELLFEPGVLDLEAILTALREEYPEEEVSLADDETILGRDTYVLEGESDRGSFRVWLDKQYLLPLRMEHDVVAEEGESVVSASAFELRFTDIQFEVEVDESLLRFTPPPGSVRDNVQRVRSGLEPGMLAPTWLPQDYGLAGWHTSGGSMGDGGTTLQEWEIRESTLKSDYGEGSLTLREELLKGDLPEALKHGERIELRGEEAWLERRDDGSTALVWKEGDIVITISADQLPDDVLLRIAESMERIPEEERTQSNAVRVKTRDTFG
jgi:outer membrane lipoprotein-sorting protein